MTGDFCSPRGDRLCSWCWKVSQMEGVVGCGNVDKLDSHAVVLVGMEEKRVEGDEN